MMTDILEGMGDDHADQTVREHNGWVQEQQQLAQQAAMAEAQGAASPDDPAQQLAVNASADAGGGF